MGCPGLHPYGIETPEMYMSIASGRILHVVRCTHLAHVFVVGQAVGVGSVHLLRKHTCFLARCMSVNLFNFHDVFARAR